MESHEPFRCAGSFSCIFFSFLFSVLFLSVVIPSIICVNLSSNFAWLPRSLYVLHEDLSTSS